MNETVTATVSVTEAEVSGSNESGGDGMGPDGRVNKGRVLIVEDEAGLAEILALHLHGAGYEPVTCHDGLQALYELDRATPSVVLLDLNLPEVTGFRLIELIKQSTDSASVPVIVITALSFQEAEDVVRAGADDFITKPFEPGEVVERVERLLARLR